MANNNLLLIVAAAAIAVLLYYFVFDKKLSGACRFCPQCGDKEPCPKCPALPLQHPESHDILNRIAKGCLHRLRGVIREDLATHDDIHEFMANGNNRLVVVTNIAPEEFVDRVSQDAVIDLKAVALSSAVVKGAKSYIVMAAANQRLHPIGAPTADFDSAFNYLESTVRKQIGPDTNNLVFLIDEDIPCPGNFAPLPVITPDHSQFAPLPVITPVHEAQPESHKESCCGRRH